MGTSGIVAGKIAATFPSVVLTEVFLIPVDALHGDLDIVNSDEVALLLSNSGETDELLVLGFSPTSSAAAPPASPHWAGSPPQSRLVVMW